MEDRENIHKGFKIFIIVFTIAALLFINRGKIIEIYERKDIDLVLYETIEDDFDYTFFNGEIIRFNDKSIGYLEDFNNLVVQKDFNFTEPVIAFGNNYIYYASGDTGDIYVLNNQLETISQINLAINVFNIEETNKFLMVHSKDQDEESLLSVDMDGNILYKNMSQDNILNYDNGTNSLAYSTISLGDEISSTLNVFDYQGQLINSMELMNEVIFKIYYIDEDMIFLTNKCLYRASDREILWKKDYPLIKNILVEKGKIQLLYSNYLETLDYSGKSLSTIELEDEYDMIVSMEDGLILHGEKDLLIIKDNENYKLSMDQNIMSVSGHEKQLIVNTEENTYIFELEEE